MGYIGIMLSISYTIQCCLYGREIMPNKENEVRLRTLLKKVEINSFAKDYVQLDATQQYYRENISFIANNYDILINYVIKDWGVISRFNPLRKIIDAKVDSLQNKNK